MNPQENNATERLKNKITENVGSKNFHEIEDPETSCRTTFLDHVVERESTHKVYQFHLLDFFAIYYFSDDLFEQLAPLMNHARRFSNDANRRLTLSRSSSPFMAIFAGAPYLLHQIWAFVSPGLYRHERNSRCRF